MKHAFFLKELGQIEDDGIREFTKYVLDRVHPTFYVNPSSSTGKYHSKQSNGVGGLMRHTRAVVYFAGILCRAYSIIGKEKDIVISASLLHDAWKFGNPPGKHTTKFHDKDAANFVFKCGIDYSTENEVPVIDKQTVLDICKPIAFHMGQWTTEDRRKKFPEEYSKTEMVVHVADMISSGKEVNLDFLN